MIVGIAISMLNQFATQLMIITPRQRRNKVIASSKATGSNSSICPSIKIKNGTESPIWKSKLKVRSVHTHVLRESVKNSPCWVCIKKSYWWLDNARNGHIVDVLTRVAQNEIIYKISNSKNNSVTKYQNDVDIEIILNYFLLF